MSIDTQMNEIAEKAKTFELNEAIQSAIELVRRLKDEGLLESQRYNIGPMDTIGRQNSLTKRTNFMNICKK
jgi:hypothetical protein